MKICVAQTRPITGDFQQNIENHERFIGQAIAHGARFIIFPELSLTGYEPSLASALAIQPGDSRLDGFQTLADAGQITIAVGAPTARTPNPGISLLLFQPNQSRQIYTKQYLHPDEEPFFTPGLPSSGLIGPKNEMALAICYEISVPAHATAACHNGAKIYIASVAKFVNGIAKANGRLAEIARQQCMTVLMANCVGSADGGECAGQSAVWNPQGKLVAQLDDTNEGILIFDAEASQLVASRSILSGGWQSVL